MDKASLRQEYIKRRLDIPANSRRDKALAIHGQLIDAVDWANVRRLHIYRSIDKWGEVDTWRLIGQISRLYPEVSIDIASQSSQLPDSFLTDYDLIVVPVLAYDDNNNRLGMGKGWYDRFLAQQSKAIKIGLAYNESRARHIPNENHDVMLNMIISA